MEQIKKVLRKAIKGHFCIKIIYDDEAELRTIHPYHFGISGNEEHLHCFQTAGPSKSGKPTAWKNFALDKIVTAELTDNTFNPPDVDLDGKTYNKLTKYSSVQCQIKYN